METEGSSDFIITNGKYAEGNRILVINPKTNKGLYAMLRNLEFLSEIQRPGDKINVHCRSGVTSKGEFVFCDVFLTREFANSEF
ncbi:MAG: hypothetical protein QXL57_04955 [Candidatus Bathyarchaeia archaeon]